VSIQCATAFKEHRADVVARLIDGNGRPRQNRFDDPPEVFRQRTAEGLDLLVKHLEGNDGFGALYAGQRNCELFRLEASPQENLDTARRAIDDDKVILRSFLEPRVAEQVLSEFERTYDEVTAALTTEAKHHVRTLFVGDCFLSEILAFAVGPLMEQGLSIEPFPINPRDPGQLRQQLASLATKTFDVVFFSPFTHARLAELDAVADPKNAFISADKRKALVDSIIEQTKALLDELSSRVECPIFIHNAGLVPRSGGPVKAIGRLALTHRVRNYAGRRINPWLAEYVSTRNASTFQHLFVLDEDAIAQKFGRARLGRFLNASEFQHATVLSRHIAMEYHWRIRAVAQLLGKKLVICDLDNTLWDGVIGEGAVTHFADRQTSLKRLKDHAGIVLSIASKNEPANVRFDGGVLALSDFVAPQISWNPKASAVGKIKSTLNLQTRHMVFIDDRTDERAMVSDAFPDILTLDACDPESWRMIELWGAMAFGSSDVDRTRMYQEQALRDAELQPAAESDGERDLAALEKLGLKISIGAAKKSDLKRVSELINRTNQWNLTGSRTTYEQIRGLSEAADAHILVASAADRFGDMGTVCVAIVTETGGQAEISAFVLSCRVFGYGVESAMLKEIARRCSVGSRCSSLVGHFKSNAQNHPCRNMYPDHGFVNDGQGTRWVSTSALPEVPWAEIRVGD
jgi:FkbH-like protein